jgi:hypothetical protein
MNSHPVVLREQGLDARQHHLHADKEPTRLGHRSKEMARKKMEFSQKQADRLIGLAEETRDPQLRRGRGPLIIRQNGGWPPAVLFGTHNALRVVGNYRSGQR